MEEEIIVESEEITDEEAEMPEDSKKRKFFVEVPENFLVNIEDITSKIEGEDGFLEDISIGGWKSKFTRTMAFCLLPKFLMNVLVVFIGQIRTRLVLVLVFISLVTSEPMVGPFSIVVGVIFIVAETFVFSFIFCCVFFSDMHSHLRTMIRYELVRKSRVYKWCLCIPHVTVISIMAFILYFPLTFYQMETGTRALWFSSCFGDCECNFPFLPDEISWYDRYFTFTGDFFGFTLIQTGLVVLFLFFFHLEPIMNYESRMPTRMLCNLGWPRNKKQVPDLRNFSLCLVTLTTTDEILRSLLEILFLCETEGDLNRLSRLQSFNHLEFRLIRGMSTSEIVFLRNFFFKTEDTDLHSSDLNVTSICASLCCENSRCCSLFCCFCPLCFGILPIFRCVRKVYRAKGLWRVSETGTAIRNKLRYQKGLEKQYNLIRFRGIKENNAKSTLKREQLLELKKELAGVLLEVDTKLFQLYRRVTHFRRLNFVQLGWKKYKVGNGPKNVAIRFLDIRCPIDVLSAKSDKKLGSKNLRLEEKWIQSVIAKKTVGGISLAARELVVTHKYLKTRYRKVLAMRRALDKAIGQVEENMILKEVELEEIFVDAQKKTEELEKELEMVESRDSDSDLDPDDILAEIVRVDGLEEEEGENDIEFETDEELDLLFTDDLDLELNEGGESTSSYARSESDNEIELIDLTHGASKTPKKQRERRIEKLEDIDLMGVSLKVSKRNSSMVVGKEAMEKQPENNVRNVEPRNGDEPEDRKSDKDEESSDLDDDEFHVVRGSFVGPLVDTNVGMEDTSGDAKLFKKLGKFIRQFNIWCCGRSLKGVFYLIILQTKLRYLYIPLSLILTFTNLPVFVLLLLFLFLESTFSTCLICCCQYRDLQSILRLSLQWEYYRKNRCTKLYHLCVLSILFVFCIFAIIDIRFWTGSGLTAIRGSVYYTADTICDCGPDKNMSPQESFNEKLESGAAAFFAHGYFWIYALTPLIKWSIVALCLCLCQTSKIVNYSGPGSIRTRNQLNSAREKSFKMAMRFPDVKIGVLKLLVKSPSEILEDLLAVLYFVRTKNDVESFRKIGSVRHLEWRLLHEFDDEWIQDLRSFFFRKGHYLEDEIPNSRRCTDFKNWSIRNERCCLCVLCLNLTCFCKIFGPYVDQVREIAFDDAREDIEDLTTETEILGIYLRRGGAKIKKKNAIISDLEGKFGEMKGLIQENEAKVEECQKLLDESLAVRKEREEMEDEIKVREGRELQKVGHIAKQLRKMKKAKKRYDQLTTERERRDSEYVSLLKSVKEKDLSASSEKEEMVEMNRMLEEGERESYNNASELYSKYKTILEAKELLEREISAKRKEKEIAQKGSAEKQEEAIKKIQKLKILVKGLGKKKKEAKQKWKLAMDEKAEWSQKKDACLKEIERLEKENKELEDSKRNKKEEGESVRSEKNTGEKEVSSDSFDD